MGSFPVLLPVALAATFLPFDVVPDIRLFDVLEPTVFVPVTPTTTVLTNWDVVVMLLLTRRSTGSALRGCSTLSLFILLVLPLSLALRRKLLILE